MLEFSVPSNLLFTTIETHTCSLLCRTPYNDTTQHISLHFSDICVHNGQSKTDYCLLDVKYKNTIPGAIKNRIEQYANIVVDWYWLQQSTTMELNKTNLYHFSRCFVLHFELQERKNSVNSHVDVLETQCDLIHR